MLGKLKPWKGDDLIKAPIGDPPIDLGALEIRGLFRNGCAIGRESNSVC